MTRHIDEEGMYVIVFARCVPAVAEVDFEVSGGRFHVAVSAQRVLD